MKQTMLSRLGVIIVLAFSLFANLAAGQVCPGGSGCLDPSFGDGGVSTIPVFGAASGEGTMQSDGKAVVLMQSGGNVEVIRFNVDGEPDLTFGGGDGVASISWAAAGGKYGVPRSIATQVDDGLEKLIVVGWTYVQDGRKVVIGVRIDRLMPDGTLDTSFGVGGSFIRKGGYANGVVVQPLDQKIVTAGNEPRNVMRLLPDGGLDTTFGAGGVVDTTNIVTGAALALQPDGKIVVVGTAAGKGQKVNMAAARFTSAGTLDTAFGTIGRTYIDFVTNSRASDVKVATDGKIVLAGAAGEFSTNDMAVARLTPSGQLDSGFNSDGKATLDFEGLTDYAWGLAVRLDGRILVVGEANTLPSYQRDMKIVGYTSNGSLDSLFGDNGIVTTDISGHSNYGRKVFFQTDPLCGCEKLVAIGMMNTPTGASVVAARYLP